jgi:hypothetical protein
VQLFGTLGLAKERADFPFLFAAFRCNSRCEGGSEERKIDWAQKVGALVFARNSGGILRRPNKKWEALVTARQKTRPRRSVMGRSNRATFFVWFEDQPIRCVKDASID